MHMMILIHIKFVNYFCQVHMYLVNFIAFPIISALFASISTIVILPAQAQLQYHAVYQMQPLSYKIIIRYDMYMYIHVLRGCVWH